VGRSQERDRELEAGRSKAGPAGGGQIELRARGPVARSAPEPPPSGKHLPLAAGLPLREECWNRLPAAIAGRMTELAGEPIEWWASSSHRVTLGSVLDIDDRPSAALIGATGACFAEPRVDSQHQPVYSVDGYLLDAASHRRADVIYRPTRPTVDETPSAGIRVPALREHPVPGLDPAALELLSNLPVRAQKLLTAPFDDEHPVQFRQWHYEGTVNQFSVFAVVLIGADRLTLAHGSRVTPVGHTEQTSHWSLVCRRATVLSQIHQ